jgi:predicted P-loop ATPase
LLITSLALRVLEPGTKVDYAFILAGAQGIGKSTFFEELAHFGGYSFYHSCTDLGTDAGDTNRTQTISFAKTIVVDLAEGVIFETRKTAMDRLKQRITQTHDEYRPLYAQSTVIEPRGFIFTGTTNRMDQLSDPSGSRRFLMLQVESIKRLDYNTKLQLIAEVVAQENEFRKSLWYALRVELEAAPEALRSEHSHISNIQTLVNTQFTRPDAENDYLQRLLDAGDVARFKNNTERMFITAGYISAKQGYSLDSMKKNLIARNLSALAASPSFPYKLEKNRPRLPQLLFTPGMEPLYTEGISNDQQMINGYIVTRK